MYGEIKTIMRSHNLDKKKEMRKMQNKMLTTYLTMSAIFDRSRRWAASTADTIAPSSADRSQTSSVARNFLAKLKNAAGPLDALTAMT